MGLKEKKRMNSIGTTLLVSGSIWFIYLGFSALELLRRHSGRIKLRFFGLGAGAGIIILSVGWLIVSGIAIESFILLCLGIVLLWMSIHRRVSHSNSGYP